MTKDRQNYALEFLRQGYTVFAPDQRGFRERLGPSPVHFRGYTRSCRQVAFDLMLNGRTILGERVADGMALFSWVKRTEGTSPIITGNSGGGTVALLQAALDERVHAVMPGSSFCTYKDSIMELSHCECNYIPNVLTVFKEIWEVAALIAPRPLLVIHGKVDPIFPIAGVQRAVKELRRYYALSTKGSPITLDMHPGGHWYVHTGAIPFLKKHAH